MRCGFTSLLVVVFVASCAERAPEKAPATFRLGIWCEVDGKMDPVESSMRASPGTPVGMVLDTDSSCSVYVIYRDSQRRVYVLFPAQGTRPDAEGFFRLLPEGATLDEQAGVEMFHVLASRKRLPELERAMRSHQLVSADQGADSGRALLDAIDELRRRYERVTQPVPTPVVLAGRIRSDTPVFEYGFDDVICRTFAIEHD